MRTTIDTRTGKPFRWNSVAHVVTPTRQVIAVPQRMTSRTAVWLHPSRVTPSLLRKLNPTLQGWY